MEVSRCEGDGSFEGRGKGITIVMSTHDPLVKDYADIVYAIEDGRVAGDGPADNAGLRGSDESVEIDGDELQIGGDVIVAIEGQAVIEMDDLIVYGPKDPARPSVTLTVLRDEEEREIEVE